MKPDIHHKTQEWLLTAIQPAASDLPGIREHLQSCAECGRLACQVRLLEERLAPGMDAPEFSPSTLKQKSAAVRMEWNRRRMKTASFTFLRYAGWTALALVVFAAGWLTYSWLRTPGDQAAPASQPIPGASGYGDSRTHPDADRRNNSNADGDRPLPHGHRSGTLRRAIDQTLICPETILRSTAARSRSRTSPSTSG